MKAKEIIKASTELVSEAGKVADNLTTSKEEEAEAINERHDRDMISDSWWSKNIRPLTLAFLLVNYFAMGYLEGIGVFTTNAAFMSQVSTLLGGVFIFYFGDRAVNGFMKIKGQHERSNKREENRQARKLKRIDKD
jgi:hypothetical protein